MKLFYRKDNNKFIGSENIDKSKIDKNTETSHVDVEESIWIDFLNDNQGKEIFIEDGLLKAKEHKKSLEQLKQEKLNELEKIEIEPLEYNNGTWSYSKNIISKLNAKINATEQEEIQWSNHKGKPDIYPKVWLKDLLKDMIAKDDKIYCLKYSIRSAESEEDINKIIINIE